MRCHLLRGHSGGGEMCGLNGGGAIWDVRVPVGMSVMMCKKPHVK